MAKGTEWPRGDSLLTRVSMFSARYRKLIALAWAAVAITAMGACVAVPADTNLEQNPPGEAGDAADLIADRFGVSEENLHEIVIFEHPTLSVDNNEYTATVERLTQELRALRSFSSTRTGSVSVTEGSLIVSEVISFYSVGAPREQSPFVTSLPSGGDVTFAIVTLNGDSREAEENIDAVIEAVDRVESESGDFRIAIGGDASILKQRTELVEQDFAFALTLNLPVTVVILLLAFRAVVAVGVPLALAFSAISVANGFLALFSQLSPLSLVYTEIVLLMGLATGIDYALFVISRYRMERARGVGSHDALLTATATSGKAVVFAGSTVVLAVSGMFLVGDAIFTSLGIAAIVVVLLAVIASVTLLPALLAMLGDNVNRVRVPFVGTSRQDVGGGLWGWLSDRVLARPALMASATLLGLLAMASPLLILNLGFNGATALSDDVEAKEALVSLQQNFTLGLTSPALVVVDAGEGNNIFADDVQARVEEALGQVDAETVTAENRSAYYGSPIQADVNDAGDTEVLRIPINADTGEERAIDAVNHLRDEILPEAFADSNARTLVGGASAANIDFRDNIMFRTPIVFAFVLALAFLILLLTFRSLVIATKAIALNLLSVGAAYGLLVLVFQEGFLLEPVFSFEATGIIESWLPLFLFSILFGLSMDYHMFIMGRIKEAHEQGHPNNEAIAIGVKATAGTISSAAAIMCAVAIIFAFTRELALQQFGFGLASAVLIDATVIRSILLPASMKLLGEANWYLPPWLKWLPEIRMAE